MVSLLNVAPVSGFVGAELAAEPHGPTVRTPDCYKKIHDVEFSEDICGTKFLAFTFSYQIKFRI